MVTTIDVDGQRTMLLHHDIHDETLDLAKEVGIVACDVETSGLDWRNDALRTVQLFVPGGHTVIVRVDDVEATRVAALLHDGNIRKVFHHAMFDLRFLCSRWDIEPDNIACTKIASKLLWPRAKSHSLRPLVRKLLGLDLDKSQQTSDWSAEPLSVEQLEYAARDVLYLPTLLEKLQERLKKQGLARLAHACFNHIPARVALELGRFPDVFTY